MFNNIAIPVSLQNGELVGSYYMRVSTLEQSRAKADPLGRQKLNLDMVGEILGKPTSKHIYIDRQSGKKDARPELQKLLTDIQLKKINWLACDRVDRIDRDIQHNLKLWDIFKQSGCQLFIFDWGKFLTFDDYSKQAADDYDRFVNDSIQAQKESRTKGMRVYASHQYSQHLGKANYYLPFGYVRTEDGKAILDTSQYSDEFTVLDVARGMVQAYLETGSFKGSCRLIYKRYGHEISDTGLNRWLFNPVLRGHMPRYTHQNFSNYKKRYSTKIDPRQRIEYNSHHDQIIVTEKQYERICELHRLAGGLVSQSSKKPTPLAGLCRCANCGFRLSMVAWKNKNSVVRTWSCQGRRKKSPKSSCVNIPQAEWGTIHYSTVEQELIKHLSNRAKELSESLVESYAPDEITLSTKELEIKNQINRLEALGKEIGEDFSIQLSKLYAQLEKPEEKQKPNQELINQLIEIFEIQGLGGSIGMLGDKDKRDIYHRFTEVIYVDRKVIKEIRLRC